MLSSLPDNEPTISRWRTYIKNNLTFDEKLIKLTMIMRPHIPSDLYVGTNKRVSKLVLDHMPLWAEEKSPSIRHFDETLRNIGRLGKARTVRALYECAEHNTRNLHFIKTTFLGIPGVDFYYFIDIQNVYYKKITYSTEQLIDDLFKHEPYVLIRSLFKQNGDDTTSLVDIDFKNTKMVNMLAILLTNTSVLDKLTNIKTNNRSEIDYYQQYLERNLHKLVSNFTKWCPDKMQQLAFFIGSSELSKTNPTLRKQLNTLFDTTYPVEYKKYNTLSSLDIIGVQHLLDTIILKPNYNSTEQTFDFI